MEQAVWVGDNHLEACRGDLGLLDHLEVCPMMDWSLEEVYSRKAVRRLYTTFWVVSLCESGF